MKTYLQIIAALSWTLLLGESTLAVEVPEYILPCNRTDPNLNDCVRRMFNHLRPYLIKGIPEINLPPIEPLLIDRMAMENGHGPVNVRAVFSNMTVTGASNYSVQNMKVDVDKYKLDISAKIPRIIVIGRYDVSGNVLLFPVRSRGDFWASFSDIAAIARVYGKLVQIEGKDYMKTERLLVDFSLGKSRFRIRDHINGENVLSEAMNRFLNENAVEIVGEMKPAATHSIARHFKQFLNNAFLKVPIEVWLHDN